MGPLPIDDWRPTASQETLVLRARLMDQLRLFFRQRGVLEVETPILSRACAPDPNIEPMGARFRDPRTAIPLPLFLHASPEAFMKRLLAAGFGAIFQVARVFRDGERGDRHNPEFTLIEWYRPGWDWRQLMEEVADLMCLLTGCEKASSLTYQEAFERHAGIDPFSAPLERLQQLAQELGLTNPHTLGRQGLLDLILAYRVEPALGQGPFFLTHYPPAQAAMAALHPGPPVTAKRFEFFFRGMELANGYQELTHAAEQRQRFTAENERRSGEGHAPLPVDEPFLAALAAGLPDCSGVAVGFDRLMMAITGARSIGEVIAFPFDRI